MIEYVKRLAGPFTSEGQSRLPFGFLIFEKTDVYVATADDPEAQAKMLVYGQDYSVEMNADQTATPGGTVVLTTPIVKGNIFVVGSAVAYTQNMQLTNFSRFPPEIINESLDRIVVQIQQLVELTGRTISLPPTSSLTVSEFLDNLLNAAKDAANSADEAAQYARICEEIKQNIFIYSWDIPHVVDTLDDVEKYPFDGFFAVGGYGDPGHHGQDISNRVVKASGSTKLRTLGERFSDVVNVRDFGAKGDGVHDDTEAIQAAISSGAGKTVFFPHGNYIVNGVTTFNLQENTRILGLGWQTTKITTGKTAEQLPYLFQVTGNNVSIEGLSFDGGRIETEKDQLRGRKGLVEYNGIYGYSHLIVDNCWIHDFCSRTIYSLANNTRITRNRIERCSLFSADLSSMCGVVTNWYSPSSNAKAMTSIVVEGNHFIECGLFASLWLNCSAIREKNNLVEYASAIGFGHQWCDDVIVIGNVFRYTYMNGVDLQECTRQIVSGNTFYMSGYMRTDSSAASDLCQSIFVGSDYSRKASRDSVISNNVIEGIWSSDLIDESEPDDFYMVGTGIVVNNSQNLTITGNVIRGMGRPYNATRLSSEDGMGVHLTNSCENIVVSDNVIESCKGCGILFGPANISNSDIRGNSIRNVGEDGIHIASSSICSGVSITGNTITGLKNIYSKAICAGIYVGTGSANISQVRVNENSVFNPENEASTPATKLFSHGIYFGYDNIIENPSYCGLGTFEIKSNFINGYSSSPIGFDSRCYSSTTARHFRTISENKYGGISGSSGAITSVENRNWAMEFVSNAQPTSGNYVIGDIVWRPYPNENPIGWVCIATGSPGTWRELNYVVPTA